MDKNKVKKLLLVFLFVFTTLSACATAQAATKKTVTQMTVGNTKSYAYKVKSSKKSVIRVAKSNGKYMVKAQKAGVATLTFYNKKGKVSKKAYVAVLKGYPTTETYVVKKKTISLKLNGLPNGVTAKYSSSDKQIATVSSKGVVTGKKKGTATITAKVYYKGKKIKTVKRKVTVVNKASAIPEQSGPAIVPTASPTVDIQCSITKDWVYLDEGYDKSNIHVVETDAKGNKNDGSGLIKGVNFFKLGYVGTTKLIVTVSGVKIGDVGIDRKVFTFPIKAISRTDPTITEPKTQYEIDTGATLTELTIFYPNGTVYTGAEIQDGCIDMAAIYSDGHVEYSPNYKTDFTPKDTPGIYPVTVTYGHLTIETQVEVWC